MLRVADNFLEGAAGQILHMGGGLRIAEQELRRENDERLSNSASIIATVHLPAKEVEVLRRCAAVADLDVVFRAELKESLHAAARMLRALPLVPMWQQQYKPTRLVPFALGGHDELIDHYLSAISEIAELSLPQHQRERIGNTVAEFKAHGGVLTKQAVHQLKPGLVRTEMLERDIARPGLIIGEFQVALSERPSRNILTR